MFATYLLQESTGDDFAWQETIWRHQDPAVFVEDGGRESDSLRPVCIAFPHAGRVYGESRHDQAGGERLSLG
jgi:hypothetical protein